MKIFNNLNRQLPKKEKELIHSIGNNILSLIEKSIHSKGDNKINNIVEK